MPGAEKLKISQVIWGCGVFLLGLALLWGCQQKREKALTPEAAAFKQEVQRSFEMLAGSLLEPVSRSDVPAIQAVLEKLMPESIKLCRACPFMIGVLDEEGIVLAVYPRKKKYPRYYSDYELIVQTLERGEVCHGQTTETEVKQRWGITEKEFLALDFNQ
ncbi:MAG: hypothetical protein JRI59_01180 [Deltaproteobacteria bacterium]|nr:hypothetical protein [Deltaproteobacteria bacterium]